MDAAKQAINKLTSNHGHHETTVHEHYQPAVTHEQVLPTREHVDTTVVDNEIHQDHHHTTVLPVKDREVLPTEHKHQIGAQKHAEFSHGDHEGIKAKVAAEAAKFTHHTETAATEKTHTVAPTVAGEHHHHHVHETIQPIIQKQTIQPSVVHTTIPVHEVHHNEPKHYTASALPAVSMEEFRKQGGSLTGLADRVERFEGEPEHIASKSSLGHGTTQGHHGDKTNLLDGAGTHGVPHDRSGVFGSEHNTTGSATSGLTGSHHHGNTSATSGLTGSNSTGATSGLTGSHHGTTGSSGLTGSNTDTSRAQQFINERDGHNGSTTGGLGGKLGTLDNNTTTADRHHGTGVGHSDSHASTGTKPSLIDRINPFKDADKDGKKGLMD